jgi:regulator of sirC expression with transglutaminase-like and TPR domain
MSDIDSSTFEEEVQDGRTPDVVLAALLFAREIAYPELQPSAYLAQLDNWAETVQRQLDPDDSTLTRIACLNDFLFGEIGLRGDRDHYTDPRNSFLNEVMTRKLGLPITLAAIFVETARRVGLAAEGVGLPGHFIVGVPLPQAERGWTYLDPFNGGATVTSADAARLVRESTGHTGSFQPQWLAPSPPRDILARMLFNLRGAYLQQEDWLQAQVTVEHLRLLQPEAPEHMRDLGLLSIRNESLRTGANLLEDYLRRKPDAEDAEAVQQTLRTVLDRFARLN